MRTILVVWLMLALAGVAHAQPGWVPAATYRNDAAHEAQASRARAALDAAGIQSVTTCSVGCTLSVETPRWRDALAVLGEIAAREHLDLAVIVPGTS